jgi:hypothetical protein
VASDLARVPFHQVVHLFPADRDRTGHPE